MSFRERWVDFIYRAATSSSRFRTLLTPLGVLFFFCILVTFSAGSLALDRFLGFPKLLPASVHIVLSVPVLAIGLFFVLWSMLFFFKVRGTPVPFNPPPRLVTTGPYAFTRNPMLTGVFILLLGIGFFMRSVSLVCIFTPLFIVLNLLELKAIEEPELEKRLGREYLEYKKRVPMFLPRLRGKGER